MTSTRIESGPGGGFTLRAVDLGVAPGDDQGVGPRGDRDFLLDCHCRTNASCENPMVQEDAYPGYRHTWLASGQPDEFLDALRSGTGASNHASVALHDKVGFRVSRYEYEKELTAPSAEAPEGLSPHAVTIRTRTLRGLPVILRPMTEGDWGLLMAWNNDPEVLYFAEEDDYQSRSLEDVQSMYREVSRHALVFMIETRGVPVGECWLQAMNLPGYEAECHGHDCRRIDIAIGDKALWGRGIGTAAVAALTRYGFETAGAEAIFLCGTADYNARSLAVAARLGYREVRRHVHPAGAKMRETIDYRLRREEYEGGSMA